jgi:signal recognition particle receptor subunit beta
MLTQNGGHGVPLVVLANKQDLPDTMSVDEISVALDLHGLFQQKPWRILPTSAQSGDGLRTALEWVSEPSLVVRVVTFRLVASFTAGKS